MQLRTAYLISLFALQACSGGSSSANGDIIDRSGRSIGKITAFSSVVVNGVAYDTQAASITVDDQPAQESDLKVGQIVVIDGLVNPDGTTGDANSISAEPTIEGEIGAINLTASSFDILTTTVVVTATTLFDPQSVTGLDTLSVGDQVSVSGFTDSNAHTIASLVSVASSGASYELRGVVSGLTNTTFTVGTQAIDYSNAVLEDFNQNIANGDFVEVEGSVVGNNVLLADRVEFEDAPGFSSDDDNTEVELEGIITRFVSPTDFDVNGIRITTDNLTSYSGGNAQSLSLDTTVEVEGRVNNNGIVLAQEIEFEQSEDIEARGFVEAVDADMDTVTILGITYTSNTNTELIDESDADIRFFSLADVTVNDYVKVKASISDTETIASRIKRQNPENDSKLKGPVNAINQPNLTVVTAEVSTSTNTSFSIRDVDVSEADFFNALSIGDTISAEGQASATGIDAQSIEID